MNIEYSKHWIKKQKIKKKDITNDLIEYALNNSKPLSDKHWKGVLNAVSRVPPSGRILKVVYKIKSNNIFVVTAFWLD